MKKIYLLYFLLTASIAFSQIPPGFSYQAMALDASGNAIISSPVKLRISILDDSATGASVYRENHNPTTNNKGVFTLTIGQGNAESGIFTGINWTNAPKFLKVEIDVNNGANYVLVGSSQLLAVPYAMVAGTVVNGDATAAGTKIYVCGSFNNFDTVTALQLQYKNGEYETYKFLPAGSELRFCFSAGASISYGYVDTGASSWALSSEGPNFAVPTAGFYRIGIKHSSADGKYIVSFRQVSVAIQQIGPQGNWVAQNFTMDNTTGMFSKIHTVTTPGLGYKILVSASPINNFSLAFTEGVLTQIADNILVPLNLPAGTYRFDIDLSSTIYGSHYTITPQ